MEIKNLFKSAGKTAKDRKAWSIDVNRVWVPVFTAQNCAGNTNIDPAVLGCPERLAIDSKTSEIKFDKSGRPVIRLAKELSTAIRDVRLNFEAGLLAEANEIAKVNPENWQKAIEANKIAGQGIKKLEAEKILNMLQSNEPDTSKANEPDTSKANEPDTSEANEPVKTGKKHKVLQSA